MTEAKNNQTFISRQFQFYIIIGVTAFVVEYGSFLVILPLVNNLFVAQTTSFLLGLAVSFLGNRHVTFNKKGEYALSHHSQLWRYVTLGIFNLLLSNVFIHILAAYIIPVLAKLMVMGMVILWNYAIFNKIIFVAKSTDRA